MMRILVVVLLSYACLFARQKGPKRKSLRALSMGNAFVAVVDDRTALYHNPAGLNFMGVPLLHSTNHLDIRLETGVVGPVGEASNLFSFYRDIVNNDNNDNGEIISDIATFDRKGLPVGVLGGLDIAFHNFGAAVWFNSIASPFADVGIIFPQAGIHYIQTDVAGEVGFAFGLLEEHLSLGMGYRMVGRHKVAGDQLSFKQVVELIDARLRDDNGPDKRDYLEDSLGIEFDLEEFEVGHGFNLGFLWQQNEEWRFGSSLQNMFLFLGEEMIIPDLTLGAVYTPAGLQSKNKWARKVNIAADFEDALNGRRNYKLFSKINVGVEWEQVAIPAVLSTRLATGFKGGYWSGGLGLHLASALHIEFVTWGEEVGFYTGQQEERYYVLQLGIGI